MCESRRRRAWIGVGVLATIGCGLACRKFLPFVVGEHLGNVLWGLMWALIVWLAAPTARAAVVAALAMAIVFGIEVFQLTPWPARWSGESTIASSLVGGVFEWHDLIGGAFGVLVGAIARQRLRPSE